MPRRAEAPTVSVRNLQSRLRVDPARIRAIILAVVSAEAPGRKGELTACFVTDPVIRDLNKRFHACDGVTDVLAFDQGDPGAFMADIVISTDTACSNARRFHTAPLFEMYLYLIHGTLHLSGYADSGRRSRAVMRAKEKAYLRKLNINPGTR